MILKQRFAGGRTQFIDIGDNFLIITCANEDWGKEMENHYGKENVKMGKDVWGFVQFNSPSCSLMKTEPLYNGFPQWIYSKDGQLFNTLMD